MAAETIPVDEPVEEGAPASRLGEPVEISTGVIVIGLPALAVLVLAAVLGPWQFRLVGVAASLAMLAVIVVVDRRVASKNMQAVWISAAYAAWFFLAVTWLVGVLAPH